MEPIFDRNGHTVGWLKEDVLRSLNGRTVAFVKNGTVFNTNGRELCKFSGGYFRHRGDAAAFTRNATGGPLKPIPSIPPIPPIPDITPIRPIFEIPNLSDIPSYSWTNKSLPEVIPGL